MKALLAGIVLIGPVAESLAMPKGCGEVRCRCKCSGGNSSKYLDWAKTASCSVSNGKSCDLTWDGGKTSTQGTLSGCDQCENQGGGDWQCGSGSSAMKTRIPAGTLEKQPPQPTQPPPSSGTTR